LNWLNLIFESQLKQIQTAQSKIQTAEADANELKEQLELQRESLASEISQVESLKEELADRDGELEKLQKHLDEAQASSKSQAENVEQTKKELDSANQEVTGLNSEIATAEAALERNVVLKLQLEQANAKAADSLKQSNYLAAETSDLLAKEQSLHEELKKFAQEDSDELSLQVSKCSQLRVNVESLQDQAQQTQLKLDQATSQFEQQQEVLGLKESEHLELQAKLDELAASHADKLVAESRKLERQGLKLDELRLALENERTKRSVIDEELKTSLRRVVELEKQADSSTVNETNYNELAQKVVKYKIAFRKNKALIEELADQKTKMSDLATEYLAAAKILRKDLEAQLEANAELKQKLSQASASGSDQADLKRLVEQSALHSCVESKISV